MNYDFSNGSSVRSHEEHGGCQRCERLVLEYDLLTYLVPAARPHGKCRLLRKTKCNGSMTHCREAQTFSPANGAQHLFER